MLTLVYTSKHHTSKGDFGAVISGNSLLLPEAFRPLIQPTGARNAAEFFGIVQAFPSGFIDLCGGDVADVLAAVEKLRTQLHGHVPESTLAPLPHHNPPLGALDPKDMPPKTKKTFGPK